MRRPNVIIILADDLGAGDLACCGAKDMQTPHLDRLFASGMRFTNFYANSCVCSPTRAALLSGRYPDLVGVPGVIRTHREDSWGYLSPSAVLLPKLLKDAGYRTAIVGKWHLGLESPNLPNERGFEHFHGFLGDMMDDYITHLRHGKNYLRLNDQEIEPKGHATDLFTTWACDFLKEQKPERPFFLYLAYNAPHAPIQPPDEWLEKVKKRQPDLDAKRAKLVALIEHLDVADVGADRRILVPPSILPGQVQKVQTLRLRQALRLGVSNHARRPGDHLRVGGTRLTRRWLGRSDGVGRGINAEQPQSDGKSQERCAADGPGNLSRRAHDLSSCCGDGPPRSWAGRKSCRCSENRRVQVRKVSCQSDAPTSGIIVRPGSQTPRRGSACGSASRENGDWRMARNTEGAKSVLLRRQRTR